MGYFDVHLLIQEQKFEAITGIRQPFRSNQNELLTFAALQAEPMEVTTICTLFCAIAIILVAAPRKSIVVLFYLWFREVYRKQHFLPLVKMCQFFFVMMTIHSLGSKHEV